MAFLASDYTTGAEALIARPGITQVRELAGKKLGLSKGTYLEYIWTTVAQRAGLKAGAVQIVDTPAEKAHALLAQKSVDAILTWEPFATQALTLVNGVRLFDTAQTPGLAWAVYAVQPKFLEQRADDVQALARVWLRTTRFIQQSPEAAYAIVAQVNKKSVDEVRVLTTQDRVLDLRDNLTAFSFAAGLDSLHGSTRQMNDFMVERNIVPTRVDTARLFEARFVRTLQANDTPP